MISSSGTPLRQAVVTNPARRPCGLNGSANVPLSPALAARLRRIWRTASVVSLARSTTPPRLTLWNSGPAVISDGSSQVLRAVTGHRIAFTSSRQIGAHYFGCCGHGDDTVPVAPGLVVREVGRIGAR